MEADNTDSDDNDDKVTVKMEVDPPLKMKGRGDPDAPIDLTSDSDSDKENDPNHPGSNWVTYNRLNPKHYRVEILEGDISGPANYIRFIFDGEETIVEGCNGKLSPIYCKALHARQADSVPNLRDDKKICDDHLHVLHPHASMKELVDHHVHKLGDPGITADVVRFCAQIMRQGMFTAHLKSLEEDIRMNDNALFETRRRLIHT